MPVHVADLAWKPVQLPVGRSEVRSWFQHGANHVLGTAFALFGLVSAAGLLGWMVVSLVGTNEKKIRVRVQGLE